MKESAHNKMIEIIDNQNEDVKRNFEQLSGSGASSWLSALPLKDQGFDLNKSEFQDALNLQYDKPLKNLPSKCPCKKKFTITHAMNCKLGGFIILRHDTVKIFEANLLKQICKDVQVEPPLQPCTGHTFAGSVNTNDNARPDVRAKGFWRQGQNAYFDVCITNVDAASHRDKPIDTVVKEQEQKKKREYNARILEVEHSTFTPIILTTKGAMGKECQIYHKSLAEKLSIKSGDRYEEVTRLMRVKLSFIVLKAALTCIRGSRTLKNDALSNCEDFSHNVNELRLV